jgi:hypothetical protein
MAVVAPASALPALDGMPGRHGAARDTIVANMALGSELLADVQPTHLLFVTGDIPLLTAEAVEHYIAASLRSGAGLTYPIIPREACEARFPGAKRTYVRLREGVMTGGNAIFTVASLLANKQDLILQLYRARKNPVQLAQLLGMGTVWRMLTGSLTLPYLEGVGSRILAAPVRALVTPYPELGFDVDKLADVQAVEQALAASCC